MTAAEHASPWVPRATCDASCVRCRGGAERSGGRGGHARRRPGDARGDPAVPAVPLLAVPLPGRSHIQRGYCRLMLRCLGVRITVSGGPIRNLRGVLVVSGHVSWVDIFAIGAVMPGSFVAKAELISWPALGVAARLMKVIPIERASLRRLPDVVSHGGRLDCAPGRPWWPSPRAPRGAAWPTGRSGPRCSRPPSTRAGRCSRCG